jgi:hypothetical protein
LVAAAQFHPWAFAFAALSSFVVRRDVATFWKQLEVFLCENDGTAVDKFAYGSEERGTKSGYKTTYDGTVEFFHPRLDRQTVYKDGGLGSDREAEVVGNKVNLALARQHETSGMCRETLQVFL